VVARAQPCLRWRLRWPSTLRAAPPLNRRDSARRPVGFASRPKPVQLFRLCSERRQRLACSLRFLRYSIPQTCVRPIRRRQRQSLRELRRSQLAACCQFRPSRRTPPKVHRH